MLTNVHIKNLALIKEADIDFSKGLNILTGETGAGKSIIIGAINIALGDKANKSMIRTGADYGLAELLFTTEDPVLLSMLESLGISPDENNILITRKLTPESSTSKINGESVTLSTLRRITSLLIDVHGQHDNQSLLDPAKHLAIVDDFGGAEIKNLKSELKSYYDKYKALRKEYLEFHLDEENLKRETELLKFELKEIEEAGLSKGEDEALETEYKKLTNSERINTDLNKAYISLADESGGVLVKIAEALKNLNEAVIYESELSSYKSSLLDLDSLAKDISRDLSHYIENNKFDGSRYKEIQERLNQINHLKSKYGNSLESISDYAQGLSEKLERYKNYESLKAEKELEMKSCAVKLNKLANDLSASRIKAARKLEPLIIRNLIDLNFLNVEFKIQFDKAAKISVNGYDKVEFMLSTNPGEPLSPMVKTASGGELSRIMLAIKSSIAENDEISTMIFDEIDTGISGKTAGKVAEKLELLSKNHQIICITHLPQIAAMADSHYSIKKEVTDGSTISGVIKLSDKERIEELANILGGVEVSSAARVNAKELIDNADKYKLTV